MLLNTLKLIKGSLGSISRLPRDVLTPVILIPFLLCVATISIYVTSLVGVFVVFMFLFVKKVYLEKRPRTRFFMMWSASSVFWLFMVFNVFVIGHLEILWEENFILVMLGLLSVALLYDTKIKASRMNLPVRVAHANDDRIFNNAAMPSTGNGSVGEHSFCKYCQCHVNSHDRHSFWIDCCVGSNNGTHFTWGVFLGMLALFYGSNLTMTTVCHPFILFNGILLPDDCEDVYYQFDTALCFVCGLYAATMALLLLLFLMKKLVCSITGGSFLSLDSIDSIK